MVNCSVLEILEKKENGIITPEIEATCEEIEKYRCALVERVEQCLDEIHSKNPENAMSWIQNNVSADIAYYVRCAVQKKEYNVLMKTPSKWKTLKDIGCKTEEQGNRLEKINEWLGCWREQGQEVSKLGVHIYETHAHYNLDVYNGYREQLLDLAYGVGVTNIIVPAIEYITNEKIVEIFDKPEYEYIKYAFGSHPKYLWKENWDSEKEAEFTKLLSHPKCLGIGETGLDYSYAEFCAEHRQKQINMFEYYIDVANQNNLPLILHIRNNDDKSSEFNATEDALSILSSNPIKTGAVLHCFCSGDESIVTNYINAGVTAFGIGGKVFYDDLLAQAVSKMPEEMLLLETDSPYVKIDEGQRPNTSLSLYDIAKRIAELRVTTIEHIFDITYNNASRLFDKKED